MAETQLQVLITVLVAMIGVLPAAASDRAKVRVLGL